MRGRIKDGCRSMSAQVAYRLMDNADEAAE